jgi:uncharacterized protein (TIGR02466 family)
MIDFQKTGITSLFPSLVFQGSIVDNDDIAGLADKILALRDVQIDSSFVDQFGNYQSDDMLQDNPDFADIAELAYVQTQEALDFLGVARDDHYITNMWANVSSNTHRHMLHTHPNCFLSGLLYVQTPPNCGETVFYDPRPGARIFEPNYLFENQYNSGTALITPEVGKMIIWPSWLPHGVEAGHASAGSERITIAFNIMLKGQINNKTAKLNLK